MKSGHPIIREFLWQCDAAEYAAKKGGSISPQVDPQTGKVTGYIVTVEKHPCGLSREDECWL